MKGGKITYYLSLLAVAAIAILLVFEINGLFEMFDVMGSRFLVYLVYYSSALFIPLILLSVILAFRFSHTKDGKKSIKLLTNVGIVYAILKIILVIITSIRLFNKGLF